MSEGKKGNFFLELDEEKGVWLMGKGKKKAASEAQPEVPSEPQTVEREPEAVAAAPAPQPQAEKKQRRAEKRGKAAAQDAPQATPPAEPLPDPVEVIRAALANSKAPETDASAPQEPDTNFATDFPLPLMQPGRRRPGPSLNPFKDMARQTRATNF